MARTQAADYGERRGAILAKAAELYAARGFQGASIADLADALGMSKSLIYHYYPSKEDILFDVMHSHVQALLDAAEAIVTREATAAAKLDALTQEFMRLYVGAAARHKVLLGELARLPAKQREIVVRIQRRLIDIVERLIAEIRPELRARRPAAMLWFGMINWTHTWLDPEGKVTPEKVASLANTIFLDGLMRGDV